MSDALERYRQLRAELEQELESARLRVKEIELALGAPQPRIQQANVYEPRLFDGTDFGGGIGRDAAEQSSPDFRDELAGLRERTQAKRRKL